MMAGLIGPFTSLRNDCWVTIRTQQYSTTMQNTKGGRAQILLSITKVQNVSSLSDSQDVAREIHELMASSQ